MIRLLLLLMLLPGIAFAQFPTTAVLDTFGTNENPAGGIWTNGATGTGACQKTSGYMTRVSGGTEDCYVTSAFGVTQEMYATLPNATNHPDNTNMRLYACLHGGVGTGTVDGYAIRFRKVAGASNDQIFVEEVTNATYTQMGATVTLELSNNAKIGLEIIAGGTVNLWVDTGGGWTLNTTRIDASPLTCTSSHIGVGASNSGHHVDDFGGGTAVTGGGSNNSLILLQNNGFIQWN